MIICLHVADYSNSWGIPHLGVFVGDAQQLELRSGDSPRELPTKWVMPTLFYRTIGLEGGNKQSARVFDSPLGTVLQLSRCYLRPATAHCPPLLFLALGRGCRRDGLLSDFLLDPLHAVATVKVKSELEGK